jgi:methionyl-tRNA formyltransferase
MRLAMMGTGTFAEPTFEVLLASRHQVVGLVTQPDRPTGKERGSTRQVGRGMKEIAREHNITVYQPENVNTPEGVATLSAWQADLLVVAAFGQILSRDILAVTPHGGINVHASLLPKYRGAAPVAWAIANGEKQTGVTVIKMSAYLDAGEMLAQEALDIGSRETAGELEARLARLGARLAMNVLDQIAAGTAHGLKQDKAQATKAPKLTKEHGAINWSKTAEQVCNHIRAMQPWPTAYSFLHRHGRTPQRVILFQAVPSSLRMPGAAKPGSILLAAGRPTDLLVAAGADGSEVVQVLELQPAGRKRMHAGEFLRGHPVEQGDCFGPDS